MNNKVLRNTRRFLFVLISLITSVTNGLAQSTMGTDFWVSFLPNSDDSAIELSLIAAGPRACSGTIENPVTHWTTSFDVNVGVTTNIPIPKPQAYSYYDSDRIINTALHIITTDTISLYASNFEEYTFDVTDVLPTTSLGSDYIIQNYSYNGKEDGSIASHHTAEKAPLYEDCAEFVIVGIEDNTQVNITLTSNSANGHYANEPFSVTLQSGECYQIQSTGHSDFTGSMISASGNKPVAVFAGNLCANVPNTSYCCCDHIVEQMMPVTSWGKQFVVTNSMMRSADAVRITSSNNNCGIWKDNDLLTTLDANQTYQFELPSSTPAFFLETSEPVQVFLYFTGSYYGGSNGDPSMVIINPIEQQIYNVTFSTFNSGTSSFHFVNIATDTENTATMQLDGNDISQQFQAVDGNPDYSYARVEVDHGSHTLSNSSGGFVAHVYGLGIDESYSYSVGSMVRNLTTQLLVNNENAAEHPDGFKCCKNEMILFDLFLDFTYSHVHWNFGDGHEGDVCPFQHSYEQAGTYSVSCNIYKETNGFEALVSTLTTTITVEEDFVTQLFLGDCYSYTWMGQTYTQSTDLEYTWTAANGCDSIENVHIDIHPSEIVNETVVACNEFEWKGNVYTASGTYEHYEGSTVQGCDSIAVLDLTIHHTPHVEILGYTQVAYSTNQWPGIYHYYVVDSTALEPGSVTWSISNHEWIYVPKSDFHCMIIAKTPGTAVLSVVTSTSYGCDTSDSIEINATNFGIADDIASAIQLYPNPAQTEVTISAPRLSRVTMFNTLGQTVADLSPEQADTITISIEDLPQGFYMVEITTAFGKTAKQLVISR